MNTATLAPSASAEVDYVYGVAYSTKVSPDYWHPVRSKPFATVAQCVLEVERVRKESARSNTTAVIVRYDQYREWRMMTPAEALAVVEQELRNA